ncbi:MAG: twin-arginine translocase TatA/TatE family subunit [Bacteroidales bacterium]|nr:MAG: twin-arginine translocase TatA/TatE family subunit [Bacteroidales bacterium]
MDLSIFLIGTPGPVEIIIIVLIILLLFGGRKIPELMKGLGQGMKEFKKAAKGDEEKENKEPIEEGNK